MELPLLWGFILPRPSMFMEYLTRCTISRADVTSSSSLSWVPFQAPAPAGKALLKKTNIYLASQAKNLRVALISNLPLLPRVRVVSKPHWLCPPKPSPRLSTCHHLRCLATSCPRLATILSCPGDSSNILSGFPASALDPLHSLPLTAVRALLLKQKSDCVTLSTGSLSPSAKSSSPYCALPAPPCVGPAYLSALLSPSSFLAPFFQPCRCPGWSPNTPNLSLHPPIQASVLAGMFFP